MTIRSLFSIFLKILGILFTKDLLTSIPQLVSFILNFNEFGFVSDAIWSVVSTLISFLIYGMIAYYLIFRSEWIIDKLKLDKGFDQDTIPLNIHRSTILSISLIVIGGLIVVNEIPGMARKVYVYFEERRMTYGQSKIDTSFFVFATAKIVIGLILMGSQRHIVNFIERRRKGG